MLNATIIVLCCERRIILLLLVFSLWVSFGQEPEPSQATGMGLVCYILGKFLGVVCHCFPPERRKCHTFLKMHFFLFLM